MLVVIAPENGGPVRERLESWARSGIVEQVVWWEPGTTSARHLGGAAEASEEIGPLLVDMEMDADRLRVVAFIGGGSLDEAAGTAAVESVRERFRHLRDEVLPPGKGPNRPTLVAVPLDTGSTFAFGGLLEEFGLRFVVSPEDRPHPTAANPAPAPDLAEESLAARAAHAIVAIGCAQGGAAPARGQTAAAIDGLAASDTAVGAIFVTRSFSRLIDLGYVVDHTASRVLRPGTGWPNPDPRSFDRAPLDERQTSDLASGYLAAHREVLGPTEFRPRRPERPEKLALWPAIKAVLRYFWAAIRRKPVEWLERRVGGMYNRVAGIVEGLLPGEGIEVIAWDESDDSEATAGGVDSRDREDPAVRDGAVAPAWRDLWALSIGLIDGRGLVGAATGRQWNPEDLLQVGNRRQLASHPDQIVPAPAEWRQLREQGFGVADAGADSEPAGQSGDAIRLVPGGQTDPVPRSLSLLERIGSGLSRDQQAVGEQTKPPAREEFDELAVFEAELKANVKRYRRGFLRRVLLLTVLAVVAGTVMLFLSLPVVFKVLFWVIELLSWPVGIGRAWSRAARKESADIELARSRVYDLINRIDLARIRRADVERIGRRIEEFRDWAEIIGSFLYEPFTASPATSVSAAEEVDRSTLPRAFAVGKGVVNRPAFDRMIKDIQAGIFEPGWLNLHGEDVIDRVAHALVPEGQEIPDVFADIYRDEASPRRVLLAEIRNGAHRRIDMSSMSSRMIERIGRYSMKELIESVVDPGAEPWDGVLGVTASWMGVPSGMDKLAELVRPQVVKIHAGTSEKGFGGSGVIVGAEGLIVTNDHVIEHAAENDGSVHVELIDGELIAATVKRRMPERDLALLEIAPPETGLRPARLGTASPTQGSMVVLVGHPFLLKGEPTLTWGLVSSSLRLVEIEGREVRLLQTSYPAASGASGSPVFDAHGSVVGIHRGGVPSSADGWRGDFISFTIPIEDVHELLQASASDGEPVGQPLQLGSPLQGGTQPVAGVSVDEFVSVLEPAGDVYMQYTLWTNGENRDAIVERVVPDRRPGAETTLADAAGVLAFYEPVRVWVSRTEISGPARVGVLRTFPEPLISPPLPPGPPDEGEGTHDV